MTMLNEMVKYLDQRFCQIFCVKSSTSTDLRVLGQVFGRYIKGQAAKSPIDIQNMLNI